MDNAPANPPIVIPGFFYWENENQQFSFKLADVVAFHPHQDADRYFVVRLRGSHSIAVPNGELTAFKTALAKRRSVFSAN